MREPRENLIQKEKPLMLPNQAEEALHNDLLAIYARAGAEVKYETDRGETRPYWAKRFLQALKRTERSGGSFVEFAARLIRMEEPSRGFLILKNAGRLDLTVEALVADTRRPYHGVFDPEVVELAKQRLADHGYVVGQQAAGTPAPTASGGQAAPPAASPAIAGGLVPGTSFDVRVTVASDGSLSFVLI